MENTKFHDEEFTAEAAENGSDEGSGLSGRRPVDLMGTVPDIRQIMAQIRSRVKSDIMRSGSMTGPAHMNAARVKGSRFASCEELRALNQGVHFSAGGRSNSISTHRQGLLGSLIVRFKQKLQAVLWESVLREYFEQERDFHVNLVRLLNQVCAELDQKASGGNRDSEVNSTLKNLDAAAKQCERRLEKLEKGLRP